MRAYNTSFFAGARSSTVGLCLCWRIERGDGSVLRFTSHDRALAYDGEEYTPATSFSGSALVQSAGLSVDNMSLTALSSDQITEDDLLSGVYDDAVVRVYLAQWTNTAAGLVPLKSGMLGEIKVAGGGFETEIRGAAERVNRTLGDTYSLECRATLGDAKCGVDLAPFTHTGSVVASGRDGRTFRMSLTLENDYLKYGKVTFTSGPNAGRSVEVLDQTGRRVILLERLPHLISVGDTFTAVAGCPKLAEVCASKFANLLNFRGFPHMPTEEEAMETPIYRVT